MTNGNDSPKHALITGGTDGIGKEIARRLALLGVQILIVGRDLAKGKRAELELRESSGNRNVDFFPADLSLIREAQRVASEAQGPQHGGQRLQRALVGRRDARPADQRLGERDGIDGEGVRGQSRSSSLIEVLARVFSSTRLTMTAQ